MIALKALVVFLFVIICALIVGILHDKPNCILEKVSLCTAILADRLASF